MNSTPKANQIDQSKSFLETILMQRLRHETMEPSPNKLFRLVS